MIGSTAYEANIDALFETADSASFFLYKEGGEPESPFFNLHYQAVADHVRRSPAAQEVPLPSTLIT